MKLKIGVVGAGNIARSAHLPAYAKLKDIAEVVAIADVNLPRAQEAAEAFGIAGAYDSVDAMLADTPLDAVDICVWNHAHAPVAIAAAQAGKAVLCEKPMADSLENALHMQQVVEAAGTPFMCAMSSRFGQEAQMLHEMIENGELGNIYYVKTGYIRRRGTPIGWFTDRSKSGGGPVIDIGVHNIDCAWYLMGRPRPVRISASTFAPFGNFETRGLNRWQALDSDISAFDTEDSATALIHFENGAVMFAEASWALNAPEGRYTQICGDKAGATLDPFVVYGENQSRFLTDNRPLTQPVNRFEQEIRHFVSCVTEGKQPLSPLSDGITVQRMLQGIYDAAQHQKEVIL